MCCGKDELQEGKIDRRRFLMGLGLVAGTTALGGCASFFREVEPSNPDLKNQFTYLAQTDGKVKELKDRLEAKGLQANLDAAKAFQIQGIVLNVIPFGSNATLAYAQHEGETAARARINLIEVEGKITELEPSQPDYKVRFIKGDEREKVLQTLYNHPTYKEFKQKMADKDLQIAEEKTQIGFHEKLVHRRAALFLYNKDSSRLEGIAAVDWAGLHTEDDRFIAEDYGFFTIQEMTLADFLSAGTGGGGAGYYECLFNCINADPELAALIIVICGIECLANLLIPGAVTVLCLTCLLEFAGCASICGGS
ncbi:hypothetical protein HYR54_00805 [Candidatus Acetothermia bacterium]|nr:hypothetical protein [Candidatus Acetothermia bacterium]